jgi:TorA maturation chaperone TorD
MVPAAASGVTNSAADVDLAVNMARQAVYRFVALSFLDPQLGSWNSLQSLRNDCLLFEAAALIRSLPEASPDAFARGERILELLDPALVLQCLPESERALNARYEAVFGLLVSSNCPPYETEYINSKFAFQRSNTLADVSGFYQAFGLTPSDQRPERPDHIAIELEFMACLLGLERDAATGGMEDRDERRRICRDAQVTFFQQHLAWWAPTFAALLEKADDSGFYSAAGAFLAALIPAERALLGVPAASQAVTRSVAEGPDLCDGCELAR